MSARESLATGSRALDDLAGEDFIDSRDLVTRLDALESDLIDDALDENLLVERKQLLEIIDEIEGYSGDRARDGITLIAEHDFENHARDLAEDIGAIDPNARWPLDCIDWQKAADELKQDYTSITINGWEYWYR